MKHFLAIISFAITMSVLAFGSEGRRQDASGPPEQVFFPTLDGGLVYANLYGNGDRGVVLAHGGRFNKESWEKQARILAKSGFRVLAIDFRGRGQSRGGPQTQPTDDGVRFDVLAAVLSCVRPAQRASRLLGQASEAGLPPKRRLRLSHMK